MNTEAANRIREIVRTIRSCYTAEELKAEFEDSDIVAELLATADSLDPRKGKFERRDDTPHTVEVIDHNEE